MFFTTFNTRPQKQVGIERMLEELTSGNPTLHQNLQRFLCEPISEMTPHLIESCIRILKENDDRDQEISLSSFGLHMAYLNLLAWQAICRYPLDHYQQPRISAAEKDKLFREVLQPLNERAKELSTRFSMQLFPIAWQHAQWKEELPLHWC